ncbi:MAG: DUF4282 domain-containing protein [Xanthobacteraceae bacterium]|nr:DUF4282 domain-containing protein [Xanthobacteraceae bacterium]
MVAFNEMIQWRKLITPVIVPLFFWGAVITTAICGVFGLFSGLFLLPDSPFLGIMVIALTIAVGCVALATVRLVAEFFLVSFRKNNHLYRIRQLVEGTDQSQS